MTLIVFFTCAALLSYVAYGSNNMYRAKGVTQTMIEKILAQLASLFLILNGFDFLDDVTIISKLDKIVGYLNQHLADGWVAATQLISLIVGLYNLVVDNAKGMAVKSYLEIKRRKDLSAKSSVSILDYAKKIAA